MKMIEKYPILMIVLGVVGISLSSIFVRYSQAPSAVTAAWRLLWTVLLMAPVVLGKEAIRSELLNMRRKTVLRSVVSGVFLAVHFAVWFESLKHTSVASSTTIVCTEMVWVALGYRIFMKGKIPPKAVAAMTAALVGSAMVAYGDSSSGAHLYGDILALVAAVAVAVYTLIGRVVREDTSTSVYTFVVYIACAAVLVMLSVVQGYDLLGYGLRPVLIGGLLAVFSTILGHSIFSWCLKFFSPSFVSASKLCEPVVAGAFAAILFGEIPRFVQTAGAALILGGVYAYSRLERSGQ